MVKEEDMESESRIVNVGTMLMGVSLVGLAMAVAALASDDGCYYGRYNGTALSYDIIGCGVYVCSDGVVHPKDLEDICPGRAAVMHAAESSGSIAIILHIVSFVVHLMQALGCQCVLKRPLSCCPSSSPYFHGITACLYTAVFVLILVGYYARFTPSDVVQARIEEARIDGGVVEDPCAPMSDNLDIGYTPFLIMMGALTETVACRLARDVRKVAGASPEAEVGIDAASKPDVENTPQV